MARFVAQEPVGGNFGNRRDLHQSTSRTSLAHTSGNKTHTDAPIDLFSKSTPVPFASYPQRLLMAASFENAPVPVKQRLNANNMLRIGCNWANLKMST